MFKIQILNTISTKGLNHFPSEHYKIASDIVHPDAILVRSYAMHDMPIPESVKVVGRAGAGINNIPVAALSKRGIPVFNTPGANANAVRELVIAGMLLASRNICSAWQYVNHLSMQDAEFYKEIEQNKKQFVGMELIGKTLGIIGLGSVGVKVANAAIGLGMQVIGYDPNITVNRAWELSASVKQARMMEEVLAKSDFVSLHVPFTEETKHMINHERLQLLKNGAIILNFARDGIIHDDALLDAIKAKKVRSYVTDFPSEKFKNHPCIISLPHLGASTWEAEENCAMMIAQQVRDFLENGSILHSANFPTIEAPCHIIGIRLAIVNDNIPNMVAQISSKLGDAGLNILSLWNRSLGDIAYTLIDVDHNLQNDVLNQIINIKGVIQLRTITPLLNACPATGIGTVDS